MNVFVADEQTRAVDAADLRAIVTAVLESEGCPPDSEVSLILVGNEEMAAYNRQFLDRPGPTDVISLPIEELDPGRLPVPTNGGPPLMLGDVILAPSYIATQAESRGDDFSDEMALMVVHGLLHLLGYDHADEKGDAAEDDDDEGDRMEAREREILESIGRKRR